MIWYLDTSAFLKLVVAEEHSDAMRAWFAEHQPAWSSQLLRTEALRAATRLGVDHEVVDEAPETVSLVLPGASTFQIAGGLGPMTLRSLDALHLGTALEVRGDLDGLVTYDDRMAEGASSDSLSVVALT